VCRPHDDLQRLNVSSSEAETELARLSYGRVPLEKRYAIKHQIPLAAGAPGRARLSACRLTRKDQNSDDRGQE